MSNCTSTATAFISQYIYSDVARVQRIDKAWNRWALHLERDSRVSYVYRMRLSMVPAPLFEAGWRTANANAGSTDGSHGMQEPEWCIGEG
jgi:hypothetical protein